MDSVYIKKDDLNRWIGKYFPNKDLISIDDLLSTIEELDADYEHLKEEFDDFKQNVEDNYKKKGM